MYLAHGLQHTHTHTCALGNILQQQRVFGQPLHLDGNDVFELQPAALALTLGLLGLEPHTHTHMHSERARTAPVT